MTAHINCRCVVQPIVTDPAILRALIRCAQLRCDFYVALCKECVPMSDEANRYGALAVAALELLEQRQRTLEITELSHVVAATT